MQLKIYTIYDSKVEVYSPPFFMRAKGEAIRAFSDMVNDGGKTTISKSPADFTLFEIGTFDDSTAAIVMYKAVVSLGCALEFVHNRDG